MLAYYGCLIAILLRRELERVCEEIENLATDVQVLSHRLHPRRLEYFGIATAAKALCREMSSQKGIEISFHADKVPDGLSSSIATCLYRVLQEALQNAIKHSGADRIDVSLGCGVDQIELIVRDFGSGLDILAIKRSGLGLASIKERLKAVDGELFIRSQPRQGTTIHVCMPLAQGAGDST
jgi:signal transduction histidine kinase